MNQQPPSDTTAARLRKQIARLQGDIALRELDRADVTIAMLTKPDDAELQAQLAKAVHDIEAWRVALEGASGALVVAQNRDTEAEESEAEAARQQSAKDARVLLSNSIKVAQQVDKAAEAFVAALMRMDDCHRQISRLSYDAGVSGEIRHNLLSIRYAGGVLAARLLKAGIHERMDSMIITRPAFSLDMTLADITKGNAERVNSQIDRALAG